MVKKSSRNSSKHSQPPVLSASEFENVFYDCYFSLKAVIFKYLKRPEDVEDIIQETFVRTYQAAQKSRILNLRAYFFSTARNLSLKHRDLQANKIVDYIEDLGISEVKDNRASVEAEVEAHKQFSIFCEAVRELPLQCRRVFILKKIYGLSHDEIAERLKITVSTTNQHLAKGIARCTLYMREKGYLEDSETFRREKLADENP
jgi:RNA polymerase sigma-70 factor (ECF subfamily)